MIPADGGRFDDLIAGQAWIFGRPSRVLSAATIADVRPVLQSVDAATAAGGWAYGFVGFEAGAAFDSAFPNQNRTAEELPLAWFALTDAPQLAAPIPLPDGAAWCGTGWTPDWPAARYGDGVTQLREAIGAGEVYQCNLTTRLRGIAPPDPLAAYAAVAHAQGGAHNAYLDLGRYVVASASPELFFTWAGDQQLTCRPMKGTSARGDDSASDSVQRARLLASDKERAENLMIVDLTRNDISRIARLGTVRVPRLFLPERYPTVWQLTSDITAELRPGIGLEAIFAALFPPGSVTGAPKAAALRLIGDLEDTVRGVYCGAIGMIAPPGSAFRARFSVAIRTLVLDRAAGTAVYGTGAGITFSSDPDVEYAETLLKAAVLTVPPAPFQLLETMRYLPGTGLHNRDRHLARLRAAADYFGFALNERDLHTALASFTGCSDPQRIRLLLDRDGTITIERSPLPPAPAGPVRLALDMPGPPTDRWTRHKTTRRDRYTSAAARHPHADDVILTDHAGRLLETTTSNLAVHLDGRWWTPAADLGCLPGTERARLLEAGRLAEAHLTTSDLHTADQFAVINSLRGWRHARLIDATRLETSLRNRCDSPEINSAD